MIPATGHTMVLLAQADALLLGARLLSRPDVANAVTMSAEDRAVMARLASFTGHADTLASFHATLDAATSSDPIAWADEHSRLFEGGSLCPPNESAFVRRDKGAILSDICGFYRAFGFDLAPGSGEKADHVVTELEFFSMMLVMLARAGERGDEEAENVTHEALAAFSRDHLDEWLPLFCARLEQTTTLGLFREVARYLSGLFETLVEVHGLPRSDRPDVGVPIVDEGTPYECGLADACGLGSERRAPERT